MELIIAPKARGDIASILTWTQANFGIRTRKRYAKLIETALEEIAGTERGGSAERPEIAENCRTYHLYHSRKKVRQGGKVSKPRHFLLYRVTAEGRVEVGRVLHDTMDLQQHLPEEYRSAEE